MPESDPSIRQKLLRGAAWAGGGLAMSAAATFGMANIVENDTIIAGHEATVSPSLDGHATFEAPGVPRVRIPTDSPLNLGVQVSFKDSSKFSDEDILIAASPQGEIERIKEQTERLLLVSTATGIGIGSLAALSFFAATRELGDKTAGSTLFVGAMVGASLSLTGALVATGDNFSKDDTAWIRLDSKIPTLKELNDPVVDTLEVEPSIITNRGIEVANSLVSSYKHAKDFYSGVLAKIDTLQTIRQPSEDETVAILISDRHDNILMDPIARAIGDKAKANIVIDAGDDTSSGSPLEEFSLNSLNTAFKGYDKISVQGNHDSGEFVSKTLKKMGWNVLDGKPVKVGPLTFLGEPDVRSSTATVRMENIEESATVQSARLARVACLSKNISTLVTHSVTSGGETANNGCVPLIVGGHLHRQAGPEEVALENGNSITIYTNGTTGGAAYAFALGKPRRDAQVTLITYNSEGQPVGLQPVTITVHGEVIVQNYFGLPSSPTVLAKPSVN